MKSDQELNDEASGLAEIYARDPEINPPWIGAVMVIVACAIGFSAGLICGLIY